MASRQNASPVWAYFTRDGSKATCKDCKKIIGISGGSTSGLVKHLRLLHKIQLNTKRKGDVDNDATGSKKTMAQSVITSFVKQDRPKSLAEISASLMAVDGFSAHAISKSSYLRLSLSRDGYNLPKNPTDIISLMTKHANAVLETLTTELEQKVKTGQRFSITLDEWTSMRNRRYLNINLHGADREVWNLGLQRVMGHFTSERTMEAVVECLRGFNIDVQRHVVMATTDGASVMVKFGRLMPTLYMTCFSHGIHLAVGDVLYKSVTEEPVEAREEPPVDGDESSDEELELDGTDSMNIEQEEGTLPQLNENYAGIVNKVRKDCKKFRRGLADEKLQEYVKREHNKELKPKLDVRVRWNSIEEMFARYVLLRPCMLKAFVDLKQKSSVSDDEFETVKEMAMVLKPVKLGNEALCRRDTTLISAEGILKFMFVQLDRQDTHFSREMCSRIRERLQQRRKTDVVTLLLFLHDPNTLQTEPTDAFFNLASKATITRLAKSELLRLRSTTVEQIERVGEQEQDIGDEVEAEEHEHEIDLEEELQKCIDESIQAKEIPDLQSETVDMKSEFRLFETSKTRTVNLEFLYRALMTIPPTSVEAERSFSAAGNFVTKIRSRLGDKSLHNLMFLKKYYQTKMAK